MRNNNPNGNDLKVKVLKKVRRQFLHKTPDENEQHVDVPEIIDPAVRYLANQEGYAVKASVGLVVVGRKMCIGPQYLSLYFNIESAVVENQTQNKLVTLNLCPNENNPAVPWEYTTKRLESYGDLELAMWAQRITSHYANYSQAMLNYFDLLNSNTPELHASLARIKARAALARREVETKYAYNKYVQFLKKDTNQPLSCTFSEGFLRKIGYTPESFISSSKEIGIPKIFETDSDVYENIIKGFLQCVPLVAESIQETPDTENIIYDKEGCKLKVKARFVNILEPVPEGMLFYCYIILDEETLENAETLPIDFEEELVQLNSTKKIITNQSESLKGIETIDNDEL